MVASVTAEAVELPAGLLIDGELIRSGTGGECAHVNPATGREQQTFPLAGTDQVEAAVAAARAAFARWRTWSPARRREVLQELVRLIRRDAEELVVINALETGTPVSQQRPRLPDIAARFDYYAGWIDKLYGDPLSPGRAMDFTLLEPAGVVAKVLTWNTPLGGRHRRRASPGRRLHRGDQAVRARPLRRGTVRPALPGGRYPRRRGERCAGRARGGWGPGAPPRRGQDQLHRRAGDGGADPAGRAPVPAAPAPCCWAGRGSAASWPTDTSCP